MCLGYQSKGLSDSYVIVTSPFQGLKFCLGTDRETGSYADEILKNILRDSGT